MFDAIDLLLHDVLERYNFDSTAFDATITSGTAMPEPKSILLLATRVGVRGSAYSKRPTKHPRRTRCPRSVAA
jgi:hypothetical protein